jgi:hypothetical protein
VDEIIFVVEEAPEGGYSARALGVSIFSEADDLEVLQKELRDAVLCHFEDESERPRTTSPAAPYSDLGCRYRPTRSRIMQVESRLHFGASRVAWYH